jgi:hypothetical protein
VSQVCFQADWNLNHIIVQAAQRREPTLDFQMPQHFATYIQHRPARVFCWYRSAYPSRQLWRTSS